MSSVLCFTESERVSYKAPGQCFVYFPIFLFVFTKIPCKIYQKVIKTELYHIISKEVLL